MRKGTKKPSNKNKPKTTIGNASSGKKPRKVKLTLKEKELPSNGVFEIQNVNYVPPVYNDKSDTYTTQSNSNTTYISVSGDELHKTYTTSEPFMVYAKEDEVEETNVKRSEMLPEYKEPSHTNLIIMLIGVAAFAALLLLLI